MIKNTIFTKKLLIVCFALLVEFGCSTTRPVLPEKAIVDISSITQAIQVQKNLDAQSDKVPPEGTPWFEVVEGNAPIIVTAPHSTKPFREGQYRFSDGGGTGALAKMLNQLAGATVVYTTFSSPSDPNYYDENDFKVALAKLIEKVHPLMILDIHGSHAYRPYDVDLGTMEGKSLFGKEEMVTDLTAILRREGVQNISCNYFGASKNQTITKFASVHGVPAIQLEISSTWLVPSQNDLSAHRFAQLLQAMVKYIELEKKKLPKASFLGTHQ
jgi:hypothetical protein